MVNIVDNESSRETTMKMVELRRKNGKESSLSNGNDNCNGFDGK